MARSAGRKWNGKRTGGGVPLPAPAAEQQSLRPVPLEGRAPACFLRSSGVLALTYVDWLLLFVLGVPLFSYVGEFWKDAIREIVRKVRSGLGRLRSRREN